MIDLLVDLIDFPIYLLKYVEHTPECLIYLFEIAIFASVIAFLCLFLVFLGVIPFDDQLALSDFVLELLLHQLQLLYDFFLLCLEVE